MTAAANYFKVHCMLPMPSHHIDIQGNVPTPGPRPAFDRVVSYVYPFRGSDASKSAQRAFSHATKMQLWLEDRLPRHIKVHLSVYSPCSYDVPCIRDWPAALDDEVDEADPAKKFKNHWKKAAYE